jgi:hypothetical protein
MTTDRTGLSAVENAVGNVVENAEREGLGVKLDEYSAWYNFVFPVF